MKLKCWIASLFLFGTILTGWAAEASPAVAVLDFSVPAAESNHWAWAEGGVADLLQIELQQQGLVLLDRDTIHAVLAEQRLSAGGLTATDRLTLARLLNAQYLITGKVVPLADGRFQMEANAFSVEAVETAVTVTGAGDFPKDLSRAVSNVARQIAQKLSGRSGFTGQIPPAARAPKPEALIMFYRGLNACARGEPGWGAACFMNAASLDPDFTVPLLWEIKACEMAGFPQAAALRRKELAEVLPRLGLETAGRTNTLESATRPVLAVLNPVVTAGNGLPDAASLEAALTRSLLATERVRVFAFQGIGAAVAEQDLRLSSFFTSQNAPRYGRWLAADALVLCRVQPAGTNSMALDLSLVNPLNACVMARVQKTGPATTLSEQVPALVGEVLAAWTNHSATAGVPAMSPEPSDRPAADDNPGLRPVYANLVAAMARVRREPENSDAHRALADAFAATGRPRVAAYEIEQCLKRLDIHAPHADITFLGTHRWLFWEPSPASGAVGFVDPRLIDQLIEQLLTTYPHSLAAGCMRYNLAVTAWRAGNWAAAATQAEQSRELMQPIIAQYDRHAPAGINRGELDCEMVAATYFLQGSSLGKLGKLEEARSVFHEGLDFMRDFKVRNFCLPLGPYMGDSFGEEQVYGFGGDPPGIQTRLEQELAKMGENFPRPSSSEASPVRVATTKAPGADWIEKGRLELEKNNFLPALECYQKAMAAGASANACPGLAAALLEIALDNNPDQPQAEMETLRRQLGFPPVEASWVDWFAAGRKYQVSKQFDYQKAAACYRGALNFLEHPEQMGLYHLEKQPDSDRVALRWGQSLAEVDLLWSQNYDARWYSAAFYLAQCLVQLDHKEEAAQWLRQIALKLGGDNAVPLLERDQWNGSGWSSDHLGIRAAELLQTLHQDGERLKFGQSDGPFKVPALGSKTRPVSALPLPTPNPIVLQVLTNSVAVLDFKVENPTANVNDRMAGLEDFFEVALQKQDVPVLERRNIRLVLAERALQSGGLLSLATLSQPKLPAVDYFVSGAVAFPATGEFALTISVIRADQATVEFTLTQHGAYPDDWLPAIESLAKEVSQRLQLPKVERAGRSEFEMLTWLPEAALPFFKGLDYYGRGDYAMAVPWFRDSYAKDRHFDLARRWEARACLKLNLPMLAETVSAAGTNGSHVSTDLKRPVVAVVAGEKIPAAGRAAFVEALAQSGRFELFDPASIGAMAREIDLQLTGQMAAPLNDRSVWLVVDDLIHLDAPDSETLAVREQNLLSGEVLRQAKIRASSVNEKNCAALAKSFLDGKSASPAQNVRTPGEGQSDLPEPTRQDQPEVALAKALRLVAANPQSARLWIGLADFYPDATRKMLLEKAVSDIATNRQSPDASFWLASALWREREMTRRIYYIPTATRLAPNPLTNDFARLFQWFPDSYEARNLVEVTNHGEGSYVYVTVKDRRYLGAVFTNNAIRPPPAATKIVSASAPVLTDAQRLSRLNDYLKQNRPAPAWQLANFLGRSKDPAVQSQAWMVRSNLLRTIARERDQFKEFTAAVTVKQPQKILELGRPLLNCVDRRQRAGVIEQCGEVIGKQTGVPARLSFLFEAAKQYRQDFILDPATGIPGNPVEYEVLENSTLIQPVVYGKDHDYEPLMGKVAEIAHELPPSDLTKDILEHIRDDSLLPREKRLTAAYDLAMLEQAQGENFEALDELKEILRQTEGTGLPLNRNNRWSQTIESAAFDALRKIRVYAETGEDICDCCGKLPDAPPQKPANFEAMNRRLDQLWKQQVGGAGTKLPPIGQQLLAGKENFLPVILYKLRTGQEVSHTLIFCADLGTNALPALPVIVQIIHRGEPFQDYNNALAALGALGRAAGCAKPLLILARENAGNGNFNYAFKRIGPAPRRVMPQLAQLLYHKNPEICKLAAQAMVETARLDKDHFKKMSADQLVTTIREWWENDGCKQDWGIDPPA